MQECALKQNLPMENGKLPLKNTVPTRPLQTTSQLSNPSEQLLHSYTEGSSHQISVTNPCCLRSSFTNLRCSNHRGTLTRNTSSLRPQQCCAHPAQASPSCPPSLGCRVAVGAVVPALLLPHTPQTPQCHYSHSASHRGLPCLQFTLVKRFTHSKKKRLFPRRKQ